METNNGKATASLVLGIMSLIAWLLPLIGFPVSIIGLIMGLYGRNSDRVGSANIGLCLSIIGLVICVANSAIGAYMGSTGQLF